MKKDSENVNKTHKIDGQAPRLIEYFLVSAISAFLATRLFLGLTGFPQIGGNGLHIAHMLWGGLLMLVSILTSLISPLGKNRVFVAISGGVGFGLFIDELGKFLTSDNNYFFQPTIAIVYIIFIFLFLLARHLSQNNQEGQDSIFNWIKNRKFYLIYNKIIRHKIVSRLILAYFILKTIFYFVIVLPLLLRPGLLIKNLQIFITFITLGIIGLFVLNGVFLYLRKQKIKSYRSFMTANLIGIFIFLVFQFANQQFFALIDLIISLVIYNVIYEKIVEEEHS